IVGTITIPVIYWLTKKLFGVWVALLAATLLAISPWHLYWSQNFRFYTLFLLTFNVAFFFFFFGLEKDDIRYFILSIVFIGAAALVQGPVAVFLIPILAMYILLLKLLPFGKPPGLRSKYLVLPIVLLFIGYVVYESYNILLKGNASVISEVYYLFINQSTASFVGYANPYIMLTSVIYYIGTPLAFLALVGTIYLLKEKSRAGLFVAVGAFGLLFIFMVLTLFASTANRYVFMSLPCWIILGSVAIKEMFVGTKSFTTKIVIAGVLFSLLILSLKDPVIEDIIYYSGKDSYFYMFVIAGGMICALAPILFIWLLRAPLQNKYFLALVLSILSLTILHPILSTIMYFNFQHGHRDNWKAVAAVVKESKVDDESLFTFTPQLSDYYIGGQAGEVTASNLETAINSDKSFWLIETEGIDRQIIVGYGEWLVNHCETVGNWDQFTAGRDWRMRAHHCTPNQSNQTHIDTN
ncbi:glycosyltransferase family 39 protein, partial [Candidatus Saccharibacteria bacterium]|nr:glycosyltransferase family 39 protein [Candidatus Saccharibacteria bacterium]